MTARDEGRREALHEPPGGGQVPAMTQQPAPPPYAWGASRSHSPRTMPSICLPPRAPGGLPSRTPSTPLLTISKPEVFCDKQVANLRVLREDVENGKHHAISLGDVVGITHTVIEK